MAVVADPVRDGARRHLVPEHLRPAAYPDVGRDHGRSLLVAGAHRLEQQVGAALVDIEVAQLVDGEQLRVRAVLEPLLQDPARPRVPQVVHEPRAAYELHLPPGAHGLDADRYRQMRLSHAGAADEQHVLRPADEPEGRELLDLGPGHGRPERPVEVGERLDTGEPRGADPQPRCPLLPRRDLGLGHLRHRLREVDLPGGHEPEVVRQRGRHAVEPQRGEVRLRPDVGAGGGERPAHPDRPLPASRAA